MKIEKINLPDPSSPATWLGVMPDLITKEVKAELQRLLEAAPKRLNGVFVRAEDGKCYGLNKAGEYFAGWGKNPPACQND